MKNIRIKHTMDNEYRIVSLDEAFKEALSLSEGESCEQEVFESNLLALINSNEDFLNGITDEYKERVIKSWEYEMDYNVWLDKVELCTISDEKYPLATTRRFIKNLLLDIHQNENDFEEGNLLERIDDFIGYNFRLCEVNLKDINYSGFYVDEDVVEEYMDEPLDTMPPIIVDIPLSETNHSLEKFPIIDGVHRCHTLEKMNIFKVKAYIPMKNY